MRAIAKAVWRCLALAINNGPGALLTVAGARWYCRRTFVVTEARFDGHGGNRHEGSSMGRGGYGVRRRVVAVLQRRSATRRAGPRQCARDADSGGRLSPGQRQAAARDCELQ